MSKNSLVTQLRTLAAQLACETELLRQEKRESRRWSGNWHQLDGQIKALLWVSREIRSLLVAAQHSRPSRRSRKPSEPLDIFVAGRALADAEAAEGRPT